jgi:hypothetical protein
VLSYQDYLQEARMFAAFSAWLHRMYVLECKLQTDGYVLGWGPDVCYIQHLPTE